MHSFVPLASALGSFIASSFAAPAPNPVLEERQLVGSVLSGVASLVPSVVSGAAADATNAAEIFSALLVAVEDTVPTKTPTSIPRTSFNISSVRILELSSGRGNFHPFEHFQRCANQFVHKWCRINP
jgi:hypothetical protein